MPCWPATKSPGEDLAIARSASWPGVRVTVSVLLPGTGSGDGPSTRAVLVTAVVRAASTWTTRVIWGAELPAASPAARVQVTWPVACPQTQPGPPALTKVVPAGTASVTTIGPTVSLGPWFCTVSRYVASWPATNGPLTVLASDRSTERRAVAVSVAWLLVRSGSKVWSVTLTWLAKVAPSAVFAGMPVVTVIAGKPVFGARVSAAFVRVHTIWVSEPLHDQPGPVAVAVEIPGGRSSTTRNGPVAVSAPWLVTTTDQARRPSRHRVAGVGLGDRHVGGVDEHRGRDRRVGVGPVGVTGRTGEVGGVDGEGVGVRHGRADARGR